MGITLCICGAATLQRANHPLRGNVWSWNQIEGSTTGKVPWWRSTGVIVLFAQVVWRPSWLTTIFARSGYIAILLSSYVKCTQYLICIMWYVHMQHMQIHKICEIEELRMQQIDNCKSCLVSYVNSMLYFRTWSATLTKGQKLCKHSMKQEDEGFTWKHVTMSHLAREFLRWLNPSTKWGYVRAAEKKPSISVSPHL